MDEALAYQTASLDKAISIYGSKERLCEYLGITKHHLHYYYPKAKGKLQPHHAYRMMELFPTWFLAERLHPDVYPPTIGKLIRKTIKEKQS